MQGSTVIILHADMELDKLNESQAESMECSEEPWCVCWGDLDISILLEICRDGRRLFSALSMINSHRKYIYSDTVSWTYPNVRNHI